MLKVTLVHDALLPVGGYGGTERVVWWLAKGLVEAGAKVLLGCREGSACPFAEVVPLHFAEPLFPQLPKADITHFFFPPADEPPFPHLVTVGGNARGGETFLRNTVFVSRNHAERHGAKAFVYNGIDPDDYLYSEAKEPFLAFLAKAAWKVKNVRGAIRVARRSRTPLRILGGARPWLPVWRGVRWEGVVGGEKKARLVSSARALLFPVRWHEPFGIAVAEALMSGTPVVGTPFGSLPELVPPFAGRLCGSEREMVDAVQAAPVYRPKDCRDWALEKFHYRVMTRAYLDLYERVLSGESLNDRAPRAAKPTGGLLALPRES